jgi:hypothetical protein
LISSGETRPVTLSSAAKTATAFEMRSACAGHAPKMSEAMNAIKIESVVFRAFMTLSDGAVWGDTGWTLAAEKKRHKSFE